MKYGYLGPEGTFSEAALRTFAQPEDELVPIRSVPEALDAVRARTVDAALVPLENSVGGGVAVTLDELIIEPDPVDESDGGPGAGDPFEPSLVITREVLLPVDFVFVGRRDSDRVAAHPQAAAQCRAWLRANMPDATVVEVLSNGAAAIEVAEGRLPAAITNPLAAERNNLSTHDSGIGDRPATTRFVLVEPVGESPPATGRDLTTLAVYIEHDQAGALYQVLGEFAKRGVNLTRIESRPTGEALGRYVFFLDCEGHVSRPPLSEALAGLNEFCATRFLGSYPSTGR